MRQLVSILFTVLGVVACSGQGSGNGNATVEGEGNCGTPSPCGGAVVGTWKIATVCTETLTGRTGSYCPGLAATWHDLKFDGMMTFNVDGTYEGALGIDGTEDVVYPADCWADASVSYTCEMLNSAVKSAADAGTTGGCTTNANGACTCHLTFHDIPTQSGGTYSVAGDTLSMSSTKSESTTQNLYCVTGNTLRVWAPDGKAWFTATRQ